MKHLSLFLLLLISGCTMLSPGPPVESYAVSAYTLTTASLTVQDIENHSAYSAETKGWGVEIGDGKGSLSPSLPMEDSGSDSSVTRPPDPKNSINAERLKQQLAEEEIASSPTGKKPIVGGLGKDFEDYLQNNFERQGSFKVGGREFDGAYGPNNSIWYEAKSGDFWESVAKPGTQGYNDFLSSD